MGIREKLGESVAFGFGRVTVVLFVLFLLGAYLTPGRSTAFAVCWFGGSIVASCVLPFAAKGIVDSMGSVAGRLFSGPKANWSATEMLRSDMDIARSSKTAHKFDQALAQVEAILKAAPDYPDALFLKAQILWEGFRDGPKAGMQLKKVMIAVPDKNEPLHRWASSLYDDIRGKNNQR